MFLSNKPKYETDRWNETRNCLQNGLHILVKSSVTVAKGLRPYTVFLRLNKRVCAKSGNNSLSAMRTTTLQQQQNHYLISKEANLIN